MTAKSIEEQIDVIRNATAKAVVSRETATAFLERAGIIDVQMVESHKKTDQSVVAKRHAKKKAD
ncbi:MAG: hypothetical protein ACHQHN_06260 [Sphingobacteriales bacterium]